MGPLSNHHLIVMSFFFYVKGKVQFRQEVCFIVHLSCPKAHQKRRAYPDTYLGLEFMLSLPTIGNIIKAVTKFGECSFIAKIEINRAQVPIDHKDTNLKGCCTGNGDIY